MQNIKKTKRPIAIALASAMSALFVFSAVPALHLGRSAHAAEEDTKEFLSTSLNITNPQFSEHSSASPVGSPTGWTGTSLGGNGNIISGVIDLSAAYSSTGSNEENANKKYDLAQYPEYTSDDSAPRTIFGTSEYEGTTAKALMINTKDGASAAYAYTSSDMTFDRNSFYRVSAWVKTYDFASDTGATIKLTGLGEYCGFPNINTVKNIEKVGKIPVLTEANKFGWVKYTMYVRTSAAHTKTVKLSLGIGDAVNEDEKNTEVMPRHARGYAFFDTVEAHKISAHDFAFETSTLTLSETRDNMYVDSTGTVLALDLYDTEYFTVDDKEIGTFSANTDMWTVAEYDEDRDEYVGNASYRFYNSYEMADIEENSFGLTKNPWAPLGKAEDTAQFENPMFEGVGGNILMINSVYNKKSSSFETGAFGLASPDVTIKRFKYYRFSVWTKGDSVESGNGISIGVKGQANNTAQNNKLDQWYTSLSGDSEDASHYGWKEQVVYIKGSDLSDCTVHFELWLGSPDGQSKGIAMFDNATFTELSYTDYSQMSGADGGSVIELDATVADTGIANGNFMTIGDYEDFEYPLPAANWSYFPAHNAAANGFSSSVVDAANIKHGIIPVDDATFEDIKHDVLTTISDPKKFANPPLYNALVISSTTPTAFAYQSPAFTVSADTAYKLTVEMAVDGVYDGYGASLVLKTADNDVVSTIENITTTNNKYKTFTFYIDAPRSEKTLNVEIWLGLNDRYRNMSKLSEGNIYVKSVSYSSWTAASDSTVDAEYAAIFERYMQDIVNPAAIGSVDYGICSFKNPSLDYYDAYSYIKGELATPYLWSVLNRAPNAVAGIFDPDHPNGYTVYPNFEKQDESGNMLLISNPAVGYTRVGLTDSLTLAANTYYRLDVTVKVKFDKADIDNKNIIGANISLTGTAPETFKNIKDTSTLKMQGKEDSRDHETFKTYTFFISTGDNGGEVGLEFSLGSSERTSQVAGKLIVSNIEFTTINNTAYDNAKASLTDYQKAVELSKTTTDNSGDNTEAPTNDIAPWIIPTVIFSTVLVAAVILIIVLRIRDKIKSKKSKNKTYSTEYDRSKAAKNIDKLAAAHNKSDDDMPPAADDLDDDLDGTTESVENETEPTEEAADSTEEDSEAEQPKPEKPADTDLDD